MKEKTSLQILALMLILLFCSLLTKCHKHEYEEIHSPHIEEDGSTLLIERK